MTDHHFSSTGAGGASDDEIRRAEAVSAVVDGVATDAEQALVTSDAGLQAQVEFLTRVQSSLREVPPLDDGLRERLLAPALSAFDSHSSTAAGTFAPLPPPSRRHGSGRWLMVAAAVVAVVATAGITLSVVTGTGDSDSPNAGDSENFQDESPTLGETDDSDDDAAASADETSAEQVPDVAASAPSASSAAVDGITDKSSLSNWVLQATDGNLRPADADTRRCDRQILGSTTYRGDDVYISVEGSMAVARDADTCGIVLETDAP
ncbi:MAG: hypothetical protein H0X22_12500 [Acidimicrobiia bacterium]|nr:hypothetical protein [Acidimicrobiia bacterium]